MQVIEEQGFRVAYDPEVPAVSVRWGEPPFALSRVIDDDRSVDYGHDGRPIAVEFLYVDEGVDLRGMPRGAQFAPLLERLGIRVAHAPGPVEPGRALAELVADQLVGYRARHDISGRALAHRLGLQQPAVVRLERGQHAPSLATLARLSEKLGLWFALEVVPPGAQPRYLAGAGPTCPVDGSRVLVAAG